jgi:hypothetical protein
MIVTFGENIEIHTNLLKYSEKEEYYELSDGGSNSSYVFRLFNDHIIFCKFDTHFTSCITLIICISSEYIHIANGTNLKNIFINKFSFNNKARYIFTDEFLKKLSEKAQYKMETDLKKELDDHNFDYSENILQNILNNMSSKKYITNQKKENPIILKEWANVMSEKILKTSNIAHFELELESESQEKIEKFIHSIKFSSLKECMEELRNNIDPMLDSEISKDTINDMENLLLKILNENPMTIKYIIDLLIKTQHSTRIKIIGKTILKHAEIKTNNLKEKVKRTTDNKVVDIIYDLLSKHKIEIPSDIHSDVISYFMMLLYDTKLNYKWTEEIDATKYLIDCMKSNIFESFYIKPLKMKCGEIVNQDYFIKKINLINTKILKEDIESIITLAKQTVYIMCTGMQICKQIHLYFNT